MHDAVKQQQFETALTDESYRRAWLFCCRLAATREDAEDLLQDALAHAFVKFDQLNQPESFCPWLLSIIRTRFFNAQRRARVSQTESYWLDTVAACEREHTASGVLADALRRLPRAQRELLCMFYLDGLSQQEVGEVLRIPAAAVGQRVFRARRALQRLLGACPAWSAELQG